MFFEGSEKKVEIKFKDSIEPLRGKHAFWKKVVERSNADILSVLTGSSCDAYLLSESSLFVYNYAIIMITCGQTSLIHAVLSILDSLPQSSVDLLVYQRKNEMFPQLQTTSFQEDAETLNKVIPGKLLSYGEDQGNQIKIFHSNHEYQPDKKDVTLEVLMHNLDLDVCHLFYANRQTPESIAAQLSLKSLLPGFHSDDFLFNPCGYSLNAINKHAYYTFHVTPEPTHSFASFETNYYFEKSPNQVIKQILNLFNPGHFMVALYEPKTKHYQLDLGIDPKSDTIEELQCGYRFHFYNYVCR
ncbi:MAG: adenosylmethionine decarboxylase [Acidobacteria bacterium]|nr:MAG: adenosylmethionine decarboxylase [Acidobacteriota bacterium]